MSQQIEVELISSRINLGRRYQYLRFQASISGKMRMTFKMIGHKGESGSEMSLGIGAGLHKLGL